MSACRRAARGGPALEPWHPRAVCRERTSALYAAPAAASVTDMTDSRPRADAAAVLDALRRMVRFLRLADRHAEARHGLSAAQLFVLRSLEGSGVRSLGELAERTLTDQSSVSIVVTRLVARGLVARRPARDDRRRTELLLTPRGRAALARAPDVAQLKIVDAVTAMPAAARRRSIDALESLVRAVGADRVAPRMLFTDEPAPRRRRVRR